MRGLMASVFTVLVALLVMLGLINGCGADLIETVASMPTEPETAYEALQAPEGDETAEAEEIIAEDENIAPQAPEETEDEPSTEELVAIEEAIPEEDADADAADASGSEGADIGAEGEIPESDPEVEADPEPVKRLWGVATITHYCSCSICAGQWAGGPTASGVMPTTNHTVACGDLPFGTRIEINGQEYVVEDRGVSGMWVDIYVGNHDEALQKGMYQAEVYIID